MKVFVVMQGDPNSGHVVQVLTSEESAHRLAEEVSAEPGSDQAYVEECEVDTL